MKACAIQVTSSNLKCVSACIKGILLKSEYCFAKRHSPRRLASAGPTRPVHPSTALWSVPVLGSTALPLLPPRGCSPWAPCSRETEGAAALHLNNDILSQKALYAVCCRSDNALRIPRPAENPTGVHVCSVKCFNMLSLQSQTFFCFVCSVVYHSECDHVCWQMRT